MFICFEGVDASGKATQSKLLAETMSAKLFSFPDYSTPMGHLILGHLKRYWRAESVDRSGIWCRLLHWLRRYRLPVSMDTANLNALMFQALQLANRMEHAMAIEHAMAVSNVVTDRYWPSGWVYGGADGLDTNYLLSIHEHLPQPDLFLLLDISPELSAKRRPERRDRYEAQAGLMEEVSHRYRGLWANMIREQGRRHWVVIDADASVFEVHDRVMAAVKNAGWNGA